MITNRLLENKLIKLLQDQAELNKDEDKIFIYRYWESEHHPLKNIVFTGCIENVIIKSNEFYKHITGEFIVDFVIEVIENIDDTISQESILTKFIYTTEYDKIILYHYIENEINNDTLWIEELVKKENSLKLNREKIEIENEQLRLEIKELKKENKLLKERKWYDIQN